MKTHPQEPHSVRELALLFLKLGTVAFGGPAAHIAMMEDEVVRRRHWLSREKFLDLLGAANLIPGPSSTELAIYIGYIRAGWIGLLLAGVCFILPAALIVGTLAWAYVQFGSLPQAVSILYGVKPVIIAVILQALWSMGRTAVKTRFLAVICLAALTLSVLGVNPLVVIFGFGSVAGLGRWITERKESTIRSLLLLLAIPPLAYASQMIAATISPNTSSRGLWPIFLVFVKLGSVVFGSGYVLLAFLRGDLVAHLHWLTDSQLIDAIAVGQVTPGPVFTTATFIGYLLAGLSGAFVATIGIFIPAFFLVAISGPLIPRIRRSPIAGAFLDGVIVASLALVAFVTYQLGTAALVDLVSIILTVGSAILLIRFRVNSAWLVLIGALIGLLRFAR